MTVAVCKICGNPVTTAPVYHPECLERAGGRWQRLDKWRVRCPECGTVRTDTEVRKFCPECGVKLAAAE